MSPIEHLKTIVYAKFGGGGGDKQSVLWLTGKDRIEKGLSEIIDHREQS